MFGLVKSVCVITFGSLSASRFIILSTLLILELRLDGWFGTSVMLGILSPGSFVVIAGGIFEISDPILLHAHEPALQMKGSADSRKRCRGGRTCCGVHPSPACLLHIWASAQMVVGDELPAAELTVHV